MKAEGAVMPMNADWVFEDLKGDFSYNAVDAIVDYLNDEIAPHFGGSVMLTIYDLKIIFTEYESMEDALDGEQVDTDEELSEQYDSVIMTNDGHVVIADFSSY